MHGSSPRGKVRRSDGLYRWQNEAAWLKRREEGEQLSTDISGDEPEEPLATFSPSSPLATAPPATALPFAVKTRAPPQSEFSRSQYRKKSLKSEAKKTNMSKAISALTVIARMMWTPRPKVLYRPNPRHFSAMYILKELDEAKDESQAVKDCLLKELMRFLYKAAYDKTFNPAVGDQMTRLAAQLAKETPLVFSEDDIAPEVISHKAQSVPEEHNIFTGDEEA